MLVRCSGCGKTWELKETPAAVIGQAIADATGANKKYWCSLDCFEASADGEKKEDRDGDR